MSRLKQFAERENLSDRDFEAGADALKVVSSPNLLKLTPHDM